MVVIVITAPERSSIEVWTGPIYLTYCSIAPEAGAIPGKDVLLRKLRGRGSSQVALVNLVQQRSLTHLKHASRCLAIPPGFLQSRADPRLLSLQLHSLPP